MQHCLGHVDNETRPSLQSLLRHTPPCSFQTREPMGRIEECYLGRWGCQEDVQQFELGGDSLGICKSLARSLSTY